MKRFGQIIAVEPDKIDAYRHYHANPWPEINEKIKECNLQNYSIFYKDGFLFTYFEYVGEDYAQDMEKMAADAKTQEWWDLVKPLLRPLETRKEGEFWADMEDVFYLP